MTYHKFADLEVYKHCPQLRKDISSLTGASFPAEEKFRLTDQIMRSSRSVTACIAAGYGRYYYKENISFCRKSRGSLEETLEHMVTAYDENYIDSGVPKTYKAQIDSCLKLLNGYIKYLNKTKPPKEEKSQKAIPKPK